MIPKYSTISAIAISVALHAAFLTAAWFIEIGSQSTEPPFFTVHLEDPQHETETVIKGNEITISKNDLSTNSSSKAPPKGEDTIELDNCESKYNVYLAKIRKKIEKEWLYPDCAWHTGEEGTSVIRFSITEQGILLETLVITSSGYRILDNESIRAVQSVAPFDPLPEKFNLSKLNIIAAFNYKVGR
ncbi:MAG: TonB family protein [Syntrophales bacterium]|nr:TonB family protein [Syntrophales bacterium]MDY0044446.1 TonB family protein [Syntrophales bacterium]